LTTEERGTDGGKKVTFKLNEETERRGAKEKVEDSIREIKLMREERMGKYKGGKKSSHGKFEDQGKILGGKD